MQCTVMLHFEELFTAVYCAKHAHYLLGGVIWLEESFRWKHMVFIEIEDVASKKLELEVSLQLQMELADLQNSGDLFTVNLKRKRKNFES